MGWKFFRFPFRPNKANESSLIKAIRNIFGFSPGNVFLYELAFKHKSASNEVINGYKISNERLEYLGDAVLGAVVADYLFKRFPYKSEGFLTEMRSRLVSRQQLNKLSQKLGLDRLVVLPGNGKAVFKSVNGDAFEALIGAIFLDKGFDFTRKVIVERIIELHIDMDALQHTEANFKSRLLEWGQKEKKNVDFVLAGEKGEGYNKQYIVEVRVDGNGMATGTDFSIKGAEQLAAEKVWSHLHTNALKVG
ncbi:MAG: ribonuclease III [Bacteroidetes bacterium]|nr:ribonuclease III [Bacteroidota bacterium]